MIRLTREQAEDIVLALRTAPYADSYAYVEQDGIGEIAIEIKRAGEIEQER